MRSVGELIATCDDLDARASRIQSGTEIGLENEEIERLRTDYQEWFADAVTQLPPGLVERFRDAYEGGTFTQKIKAFLQSPTSVSPFYDKDATQPNPFLGYWQHEYESKWKSHLLTQRQILLEAERLVESRTAIHQLEAVQRIARKLPDAVRPLRDRKNGRPDFIIENEYDLRDFFHSLLRVSFEDVREEEWTPSYGGGSKRIDFVLKLERVAIELKMMRPSLSASAVGDELAVDIVKYRSHPECDALVAVVYDPERRIVNARGLENDLTGERHGLPVSVVVVQ